MERKVINRKHFSFWSLKNWTFSVLSKFLVPTQEYLYICLGVLGGIVVVFWVVWGLFGVVLVILLVKNFAISGKVATFVTANEGYASWLKC